MFGEGPACKLILVFAWLVGSVLAGGQVRQPALEDAMAAYQQGKPAEAEPIVETILKQQPSDLGALVLMGIVLDAERRYADAEAYYVRALKIAPASARVLNNVANHYLGSGDRNRAREMYLKAVNIEPHHVNANLQLAQMSVEDREGQRALKYLDQVAAGSSSDSGMIVLRARALGLCGRCGEVNEILGKPEDQPGDAAWQLSAGTALAECKLYSAAEQAFSRALDADPQNFEILYNLGLAALRSGHAERAQHVLQAALRQRPDDADALYALAQVMLKRERRVEAAALLAKAQKQAPERADIVLLVAQIFKHLRPADLSPEQMAECGRILLEFQLFGQARGYLESALAAAPSASVTRLDLSIAVFHLNGADAALQELDKTPAADRKGDYYLLRAQLLDAQGKLQDAAAALNQGMRAAPSRASLYYQAVGFLLKHKLYREAQTLLEEASRILPEDRQLLFAQVVTLNLLRRNPEAEKLLARIQARWPQWERVYLLKGILLEIELKSAEARQTLDRAIALGANTPEAYYYDALAIMHSAPQDLDAAQNAISHALALTSQDPYIYLLAGKIAIARKDYAAAIERLLGATHLEPSLMPAHYELRHAYTALGQAQKAQAEVETMRHIAKETGGTDESRFSVADFLFTVQPPG